MGSGVASAAVGGLSGADAWAGIAAAREMAVIAVTTVIQLVLFIAPR
jgi:hypothetical protein